MRDKVFDIEKWLEVFVYEVYKSDWFKKIVGNCFGVLIE